MGSVILWAGARSGLQQCPLRKHGCKSTSFVVCALRPDGQPCIPTLRPRWVTPAAILQSAAALLQASKAMGGNATSPQHWPQLDRLRIGPRYMLLMNWNASCAHARARAQAWPVPRALSALLSELERSLATAGMAEIRPGVPVAWFRTRSSGLDLGAICNVNQSG